mmetsp:Transcript_19703/g.55022  ORF Transcript_19703/g.55022 Transcript_19703/m.55022 type:complete len:265 (+) Transcript_19703:878-1672(+)
MRLFPLLAHQENDGRPQDAGGPENQEARKAPQRLSRPFAQRQEVRALPGIAAETHQGRPSPGGGICGRRRRWGRRGWRLEAIPERGAGRQGLPDHEGGGHENPGPRHDLRPTRLVAGPGPAGPAAARPAQCQRGRWSRLGRRSDPPAGQRRQEQHCPQQRHSERRTQHYRRAVRAGPAAQRCGLYEQRAPGDAPGHAAQWPSPQDPAATPQGKGGTVAREPHGKACRLFGAHRHYRRSQPGNSPGRGSSIRGYEPDGPRSGHRL